MAKSGNETIPVINVQDLTGQPAKVVKACEEWGCFRLINFESILSKSLMMEIKAVAKSLFELPVDMKVKNVDVIPGSGYMAPSKINFLHEGLGIYDMSNVDGIEEFCSILEATPYQRATILKYGAAANELMTYICRTIGEGLGIGDFPYKDRVCHQRMNIFNFTPETMDCNGMQLHTDSGFLTILQDDEEVGGLQVMKKCGMFVDVEPFPGALTILLGDITEVWSNRRFVNVRHRVICKQPSTRISVASGILGPKEGKVEVHDHFVDEDHPRLYVPFTYGEYRQVRVSKLLTCGGATDPFLV